MKAHDAVRPPRCASSRTPSKTISSSARSLTQVNQARVLQVNQGAVSRLEKRTDMYVSSYIQAMGGRLQVKAIFPAKLLPMDQPSVVFGFQEGWNHLWERYPRFEEVLPRLHQLRSAVFDGASAIKTTPISTRTATPISSPRATMLRHAWVPMRAACAKLDHAVKAITLRLADGLRMAKSRKTPSVTYRLNCRASTCGR